MRDASAEVRKSEEEVGAENTGSEAIETSVPVSERHWWTRGDKHVELRRSWDELVKDRLQVTCTVDLRCNSEQDFDFVFLDVCHC